MRDRPGPDSGTLNDLTFTDVEYLEGGDATDTFQLKLPGRISGQLDGRAGNDTLIGSDQNNNWNVTNVDEGELNSLAFFGIEDLLGGAGEDEFIFAIGGFISGAVIGRAGSDRMRGSSQRNNTWRITGANAGKLNNQVSFEDIENLEGGADNEDTYIFEVDGSITGVVEGGDGGFDSILLEEGGFDNVVYNFTGLDSGSIERQPGDVITYSGFEPISTTPDPFDPSSGPADVTLNYFITTEDQTVTIRGDGNDIVVDSDQAEVITFARPTNSLTINTGIIWDQTVIVRDLGNFNGTLNITTDIGDDTIEFKEFTGGVTYSVDAGAIGTDTLKVGNDSDMTLTDANIVMGPVAIALHSSFERVEFTGGPSTQNINTSAFSGSVIALRSGVPTWLEEGPGGVSGSSLWSPVAASVNAVAVQPGKTNTMFIGSVSGGIWRTTDGGNHWDPLTDNQSSLAISTLALSPLDSLGNPVTGTTPLNHLVLVAGTGDQSSAAGGGAATGLLFSNDGGTTWVPIGATQLDDLRVTRVLPTTLQHGFDQVIYVSTYDKDVDGTAGPDDKGGVFRLDIDIDSSVSTTKLNSAALTKVSGSAGFNLPAGSYTDLAFDPGVPSDPAKKARIYAANPQSGVFSLEDGVTNWVALKTDFSANTKRIKLAAAPTTAASGSGRIYAMVIGPNPTPSTGTGLTHIFRSANHGGSWNSVAIPTTSDGSPAVTTGLHPGGQGDLHGSIAVDPVNQDIIYVGGDTQKSLTNNAAGLTQWGARLFRYNPGSSDWTQIVGTAVSGSSPHADSRSIVFVDDNTLLETDDGGLYKLPNPRSGTSATPSTSQWQSLVGDLRISEVSSVRWDSLNNVVFGGTQDNGSSQQSTSAHDATDDNGDGVAGDLLERISGWTSIHGGDGAAQEVVVYADGGTVNNRVIRLSMSNNFQFVYKQTFKDDGTQVGNRTRVLFKSGAAGAADYSGLVNPLDSPVNFLKDGSGNPVDTSGNPTTTKVYTGFRGFTTMPMAVNRLDNNRMVIGLFSIYESSDRLDTVKEAFHGVTSKSSTGRFPWESKIHALVYGGMDGTAEKPDLIVAAQGNPYGGVVKVLYRETAGNAFTARTVPGASGVRDIVVDPDNWKTAYVIDKTSVYKTADITASSPTWKKISPNFTDLRTIEYIKGTATDVLNGTEDILLVGGQQGVMRLNDPQTVTDAAGAVWTEFGLGLPNAPVSDIQFYDVDGNGAVSSTDKLVIATQGRGIWTLNSLVDLVPEFIGTSGNDNFNVIRNATDKSIIDVFDLNKSTTVPVYSAPAGTITSMIFYGLGGDDTLTVDHSNGAVSIAQGILFEGGGDNDKVVLAGDDIGDRFTGTVNYKNPITGTTATKDYHLLFDSVFNRVNGELVLYHDVETLDDSAFFGWGHPLNSLKLGLYWLLEAIGLKGENVPVFGGSLDSAVRGTTVAERLPKGDPARTPSVSILDQISEESGTNSLVERLLETGPNGFNIADIGTGLLSTLTGVTSALENLDSTPNVEFRDGSAPGKPFYDSTLDPFYEWTFGLEKTLGGTADLDFDFDAGVGSVDISGKVDVSVDVGLNLVFGIDEKGFYVRTQDGGTNPVEFTVDNFVVNPSDDVRATGRFGFLDVALTALDLGVDTDPTNGVRLDLDITKGLATDTRLRIQDLISDPTGLLDLDLKGNPANSSDTDPNTNDLELTGTFEVSALVPGRADPALTLGTVKVDLKWADITDITNVDVSATPGFAGGEALRQLLYIKPQDILDQLTQLRNQLEQIRTLAGDDTPFGVNVPFAEEALGDLINIVNTFNSNLLQPLTNAETGGTSFRSVQELARDLSSSLGVGLDDLNLGFSGGELTYDIAFTEALINSNSDLGLAFDLKEGLADLKVDGQTDITSNIMFSFTLGADLGAMAGGGAVADNIFIRERDDPSTRDRNCRSSTPISTSR